jgi:UrcA family protein
MHTTKRTGPDNRWAQPLMEKEIMMTAIPTSAFGLKALAPAAAVALALSAAPAQAAPAADNPEVPAVHVRYSDLDLTTPEGARALYHRIVIAAHEVCPADGLDLQHLMESQKCAEQAIARAVGELHNPQLSALNQKLPVG